MLVKLYQKNFSFALHYKKKKKKKSVCGKLEDRIKNETERDGELNKK